MNFLTSLGESTIDFIRRFGRAHLLLLRIFLGILDIKKKPRLLLEQIFSIGVLTFLIIVVAGIFVGMVVSLQGYYILSRFGGETALGLMVAASLVRELGPVLTALLFAGRAGSAITAEIGLMKATEQLSSLEMMAINPKYRILAPRFFAGLISVPMLTAIFSIMGILGGWLVAGGWLGLNEATFWNGMQEGIDFYEDIVNGLIKSIIFGFVCIWIALFQGFDCSPTSEGLSRATTNTVVFSSLAVLGLDFILTAVMFGT